MTVRRQLLADILDGIGDCFYAVDRDWRITVFNRGAEEHFGRSRDEVVGLSVWDLRPGSYETELGRVMRDAMAGSRPVQVEVDSLVLDGRIMEGRLFPIQGGMGVAFRDITARRQSETALRKREAELARVQRIAGVGGLEVDLGSEFVNRRSPEYLLLHGLPPEAAGETHEDWVRRIHPEDREETDRFFREAVAGTAERYDAEYRIVRPRDGAVRWIAATAEIERDGDGRAVRLVGAHRDVTERRSGEERRRLLINELNHRVKNTLATVQSIAAQSLRSASTPEEGWKAFEARLMALSRVHDVLTREDWAGADLRDIVLEATEPYRGSGPVERILVQGASLNLRPQQALAISMAIQELVTNALKHGSLSIDAGSVAITWQVEGDTEPRLRLQWEESGGPPVVRPVRRGFGSRLVERSLAAELCGEVRMDFAPTGFACSIDAPLGVRTAPAASWSDDPGSAPT